MFFEDFELGTVYEIAPVKIEKERMVEFARLYDPIPLHLDDEYAKGTRFGALIAPGVMSFMSVWARFLDLKLFGDQLVAGKSTKIEWHKPVYADDVLYGRAIVSAIEARNLRNGMITVTVEVKNQHGELVLTDVTESVILRRGADQ